ncbi:YjbH domain-containing protein [Vibrio paucivorans]|uniref:YjbH domain-containing protein n=1 Tax=Vibrio paucivorans TaxID=2829489 RepID=A0A9X3HQM9_9VIBR|nr:YjbH domain-containing protein [Vibrio paucivorans]MCW8332802.1 YjbH domain-containing protein [Vibrio paucivorans]
MKTQKPTLLLASIGLLSTAPSFASTDANWKVSQSDFGGTGLMQTPTGRMAEPGEFNIGGNWNQDYHHYMASIQLMPWAEATIRYTRVPDVLFNPDPNYSGDNLYTDKGIDVKFRLLEESYWIPETSIGIRDFGGTGMFDGQYIAATKRFGPVDFTLGFGWGYLGQSGSATNPFCKIDEDFCDRDGDIHNVKGKGGLVEFERWFKGPASFFGGIEYQTPYEPLRIKIEYEGNDYSEDFPTQENDRNPEPKDMTQHTPWNFGVNYRLGDWGDAKLSYQRGDTVTFGVNVYTNFNDMKAIWRDDEKPAAEMRPTAFDTVEDTDWDKVSKELESNAGYKQNTVSVKDDTVIVKGEQKKYRDRSEAYDRAARVLNNNSTESIKTFEIVEQKNGLDMTKTTIDRETFVNAANHMSIDSDVEDAFSTTEPITERGQEVASSKERWDYNFSPVLKQSIGGPEAFYLYHFGINANSNVWLTDNIELGGSIYFNLFDNYDKYNYGTDSPQSPHVSNEATPRVRTMFRSYVHDNPVRLEHLQLTWFEQPMDEIYTQTYAGYLEMMFAGVGGEVLYRPMNSNWAFGLDANFISQRDPDSWFGVYDEDYFYYDGSDPNSAECVANPTSCRAYVLNKGFTGHLTTYYTPEWSFLDSTLFKVSAGQFLGGDVGARIDFSKQFKSGVSVGAYATFTNLTAEEYGEGSYNKGFYISIPLDIMTIKPGVGRANIGWEPITRDGGQMLNRQHYLYSVTDSRSPWYQRPNSVE